MMGKSNLATDGSALITNNFNKDSKKYGKKDGKLWCDHCERYYHTRETCWKIHGRPLNWKKKGEGRALQTTSDQEPQSSPNAFPFIKEQLKQMYKLLESQTLSCSIAEKGIFPKSAHLSVTPIRTWIIDSGATDHMTGESSLFSSYKPCAGNSKIKIADGPLSAVAGKSSIVLSPLLTIQDVLHVPNLSCNLLSVNQLITDKNCHVHFLDTHCVFQDLISGKVIGTAEKRGGLYYLEDEPKTRRQSGPISFSSVKSFFVSNNKDDIMLWHLRLGHPSFKYLNFLFPKLFVEQGISSLQCEVCEFAKHHRSSFPIQSYKPSKPFSMIHSDVWGPNRTSTLSNKKWFITFTDDHTRLCWVYLLKEKSEVGQIIQNFCKLVQTQFNTQIQVFRTDNGT